MDEENSDLIPQGFHGDFTVFALVPFELYRLRGDMRFYMLELKMVDEQWKDPNPEDGLIWQARWWIDDVYMIASVDALATRITGDQTYVYNAALLIHAYCSKLQHDNGLLPHTENVPYYWGRGVGWVAAGMTEALTEKINENVEISDVCVGTNEMEGAEAYLQRTRRTGDFHGQAPVLWCANALMRK